MTRQSANGHRPARPGPAADWTRLQYRPTGAPLLTCARAGCGAKWIDDEPGRLAHIAVFGHSPRTLEAVRTAESTGGESP
jgi:hypothetical protein